MNGLHTYIPPVMNLGTLGDSKQKKIVRLRQNVTLDIIFSNKIEQGSFECIVTEHKETEKELKEAKKWTGKFIFGLTDKSCAL